MDVTEYNKTIPTAKWTKRQSYDDAYYSNTILCGLKFGSTGRTLFKNGNIPDRIRRGWSEGKKLVIQN